jgi:hypothetical protein
MMPSFLHGFQAYNIPKRLQSINHSVHVVVLASFPYLDFTFHSFHPDLMRIFLFLVCVCAVCARSQDDPETRLRVRNEKIEAILRTQDRRTIHDGRLVSLLFDGDSAGKDTEGSQFFITHSPQPHLDGKYTIVGRVINGQDVVDSIQRDDRLFDIRLR